MILTDFNSYHFSYSPEYNTIPSTKAIEPTAREYKQSSYRGRMSCTEACAPSKSALVVAEFCSHIEIFILGLRLTINASPFYLSFGCALCLIACFILLCAVIRDFIEA